MSFFYQIHEKVVAKAPKQMQNETTKNLWHHFTFTESEIDFTESTGFLFQIGNGEVPELEKHKEFTYRVDEKGIAIHANSYPALMRGYCDLLMQIEVDYANGGVLAIRAQKKSDGFTVKNRMIHFCIFKDTDRLRFRKLLRLSGLLGYTHVILEFWSTYKFECLKEYGWDGSYTKEEIQSLLQEIRDFGMEPIPMINHLGHAAGSRITGGKHAVLDQNPKLHRLFMPDGWNWNIFNPDTLAILRKMRAELYDIFGDCKYFHAGVDEAYAFAIDPKLRQILPQYLTNLAQEILSEGRRPMLWMDMFLPLESETDHLCSCSVEQTEAFLSSIPEDTILVDWNYNSHVSPMPTSVFLKAKARQDIMIAPWDNLKNIDATINTATQCNLFGVMVTTWHSMFMNTPSILHAAQRMGCTKTPWLAASDGELNRTETATLLRKLSFEGPNSYEEAGWTRNEVLDNIGILL